MKNLRLISRFYSTPVNIYNFSPTLFNLLFNSLHNLYANFYFCVSVILLVVNKRKGGLRVGDNMSSETELMMSLGERG